MVQRRPITSHPRFAPLIALWFAALLGLIVAVLPEAALERLLSAVALGGLAPLTVATRIALAIAAAAIGVVTGFALARWMTRRIGGDPRPIYAEAEPDFVAPADEPRARRPLHVREELEGGFGDESQVLQGQPRAPPTRSQTEDTFMILTPQPVHPTRPEPDLEALLAQFDTAFEAFRAGEDTRAGQAGSSPAVDPVQSFVARQTAATAPAPSPVSPLGGVAPDHQAELRAVLDKLARSQGEL